MTVNKNFKLLVDNYYDQATLALSTGTEAGEMLLSNTQQYGNEMRFVSTDFNQVVITGNFDIAKLLSGFVLYRHNLSNTATFQLEIFDDLNQVGVKVYDSLTTPAVQQRNYDEWDWRIEKLVSSPFDNWAVRFSQLWFAEVFGLSFRITINDPDNEAGEIEVTRIYMGRTFSPSRNFNWGQKTQVKSNSKQVRTDGASLYTKVKKKFRHVTFSAMLSDIDRVAFFNATDHLGKDIDFFITLYPNSNNQQEMESALAGKFTVIPALTNAGHDKNMTNAQIEEC